MALLYQVEKAMPKSFGQKMKLKLCDVQTRTKGNLTAIAWQDEQK
jgi:hypothetical protein